VTCVRDCVVDLSLVCCSPLSYLCASFLIIIVRVRGSKPCGDSSQTGERLRKEKLWFSSRSSDHLKGVECNPRPLGCHNVEVGKCYLAEPRDKNHVSLVCFLFDCLCSQELVSSYLAVLNLITKFCGY
jgi:hypothetical protein